MEYLIQEYLKKLTINDILNYANKNNLTVSEHDANILLFFAKQYYKELIKGDSDKIFKALKPQINIETYKIVYKMYLDMKMKYLK